MANADNDATAGLDVFLVNALSTLLDGVDAVRQTLDPVPDFLVLGVFATILKTLFKGIAFLFQSLDFGCQF
ncbi:MAG: hypothetical protein WBW33_06420 [Bryobacteraceae bacterium]